MLLCWLLASICITLSPVVATRKVFNYEILRDFPRECYEAKRMDDASRRFDKPEDSPTSSQMDNKLEPGWYWFMGQSGNALKEGYDKLLKADETPPNYCSTQYSGTLMGKHPTEEEGAVEMTVCFRGRNCYKENLKSCQCKSKRTIYVRNCRKHYIYFLVPTGVGERYCTNQITMPKQNDRVNVSAVTECKQYRELPKGNSFTDNRLWNQVQDVQCDKDLYGWYRFTATEGGEMASQCLENQNVSRSSLYGQPCGANFRGWMVDKHPTVEDGRVQRRVCFSYDQRCLCEFYTNAGVRNCGDYYVYRLNPVPTCNARYCGAPANKKAKDNDYSKPAALAPFDLCKSYDVRYDPDRLWSYTSPIVMKCDADLYGKYRFGSKYTPWRIKEGCNRDDSNSVTHRCGSKFHGYMIGTHPVPKEGYVERVVCFENSDAPCECQHTTTVGVQNCGGFYVYYLKGVPSCDARYCMVANNSAAIRLNTGLPPMYEIPTPNEKPVVAKVTNEKDDDGNGGLIATTTALSILLLIIIIILIIIIVLLILKVWPAYKRRRRGSRTPSYVSSTHEIPQHHQKQGNSKQKEIPLNGDLPKESEQLPPYPSVLPPADNKAAAQQQPSPPAANDEATASIPEDLELSDDDENETRDDDCDTLMKPEDRMKPTSYDKLPSKDSAV